MLIDISGINIYFEKYLNDAHGLTSDQIGSNNVVLIHGFTGSTKDWEPIIPHLSKKFNYYSIDIIGHGNSDSPPQEKYYTQASIVELLNKIIKEVISGKFILVGYSMGGRVSVSYAVNYPDKIEGLILESTSAGIEDNEERNIRKQSDEELSKFIEKHSVEEFISFWMEQDIFNTQKRFANSKLNAIKDIKLNNNKTGLALFLRGFGTGQMIPLYDQLKKIKSKTLLITGDLDDKFNLINNYMASLFLSAKHVTLKNSGHNTHLETPNSFIKTVNNFLDSL